MSDYILSRESAVDLTQEHLDRRNISCIPFSYELGGTSYHDDLWQSISSAGFYQAMVDGADTRTSQINAAEYESYFARFLEAGRDVLHLCLSSGITGTVNSARQAADLVEARFPKLEGRVEINSIGPTIGSHSGPGTVALFFWGKPREN